MSEVFKCVVVTGGSRGLGLALVQDLLEHGYSVATCSRQSSRELEGLHDGFEPDRLFWSACRIGEPKEEESFFIHTEKWAGSRGIYGLINNTGIVQEGILATFPNVDTTEIIEVNLLGVIRMSRLALRHMLRHHRAGRIVNISSITGSRGYTGLAAYSASKAGVDGLTRSLAREVGRQGITVNSVAPGYLETQLSSTLSQKQRQQIINRTPMGRLGRVEDISPIVRFLLSENARFLTGQTILVDGGITC